MKVTFSVSCPDGRLLDCEYEIPDSLDELKRLWGEHVVLSLIAQRMKGRLGHLVRMWMLASKTDEEIAELLRRYKPTLREDRVRATIEQLESDLRALSGASSLSDDERKELVRKLAAKYRRAQ